MTAANQTPGAAAPVDKDLANVNLRLLSLCAIALLPACSKSGTIEQGGIYITRSSCPQLGIPAGTGDITLFDPVGSTDARASGRSAVALQARTWATLSPRSR